MICAGPVLLIGTLYALIVELGIGIIYPVGLVGDLKKRIGGLGLISYVKALTNRVNAVWSLF